MARMEQRKLSATKRQREMAKKKKKRRKRMIFLTVELILLCVLSVVAYGMFKLGKLNKVNIDDDKLVNNGLAQEGYTNIALFGTDARPDEEASRSDTIMVASINNKTKEVRILSVYRDTMLQQDEQIYDKANSAYMIGGPEAAINMLNRNLDVDITDYVSVNFLALSDVIDLLDGLEIDMTAEEVVHMNNYCEETSEITGKDYTKIEPEIAGTYHLNGVQSVSYARIRYTEGGDFQRTARQRLIIEKIVDKAKKSNLSTINKIIDAVLPEVSTSFSSTEIVKLAASAFDYSIGDTSGFPFDPVTPDSVPGYDGSFVVAKDLIGNVKQAHQFLFPDESYEPTETVRSISDELCYITGIYSEDSQTQEQSGSTYTEGAGNTDYAGEPYNEGQTY